MKKENSIIIMTIIIVFLVALLVFLYNPKPQNQNSINNSQNSNKTLNIDLSEISKHKTINDCWISYNKSVYDLTLWLPKHPGSAQAILPYCGSSSEFEKAFNNAHNSSKVQRLIKEGIYKGALK